MQIKPILAALKHHRAGTALIALQIALTLAIVCNALFIVTQREALLSRPSGVDEANMLVIQNQWVGKPDASHIASMVAADTQALRQIPGVVDVYDTNAWPLGDSGTAFGMGHTSDKLSYTSLTSIYYADDHALNTLGLRLLSGRNFRPDEVINHDGLDRVEPGEVIVTKDLADVMFPDGSALGKPVYISNKPSTVIGIVERLEVPWVSNQTWNERSTLIPARWLATDGSNYVVRTQPGQLAQVRSAVRKVLMSTNRMRVIDADDGVQTYAEIRSDAYKSDRGMAILMAVICVMLLAITAAGIVGLTSFWVGQRRKQIGVRRALGATRRDILEYFLTENLLISIGGSALGTVLGVGLNLFLIQRFELARMPLSYIAAGVVVLLLLGQGAVFSPALRASRVSPVEATRPA